MVYGEVTLDHQRQGGAAAGRRDDREVDGGDGPPSGRRSQSGARLALVGLPLLRKPVDPVSARCAHAPAGKGLAREITT